MEVYHYKEIENIKKRNLALGIGKFDGFHLGHQKIVERIKEISRDKKLIPSIFTFRRFPAQFYLYGWEEKLNFIENAEIEVCIWSDFEEISSWSAERFLDFLQKIGVKEIVVGFNFHFGKDRKGNTEYLKKVQKKYGFSLSIIPPVRIGNEIVNSSRIKNLLEKGEIENVNRLLGRDFSIKGKVIEGNSRGKKLGFPTANILPSNKVEIGNGVYAGYVRYEGKFYKGAINIGICPTFSGKEKRIEVHILDFDKDIYGQIIEIYLLKKIRDEMDFGSEDKLKERIKEDLKIVSKIKLPDSNLLFSPA